MKLNKSILGSALVIVLLFSACSQARYGNLTRRVKTNHVAKNVEKPVKPIIKLKEETVTNNIIVAEEVQNADKAEVIAANEAKEINNEIVTFSEKGISTSRALEKALKLPRE